MFDQADSPRAWELATGEHPAFPVNGPNCITFTGTKGAPEFPNLRQWRSVGGIDSWTTPKASMNVHVESVDAFIEQISQFADVIAGRAEPKITAADASEVLKVTLAVLKSARIGRRVPI